MTETSLLTISAFARTVGLTPSALRFYDDAGLLTPATVDDRTGYRYYADGQRRRAVLVRQMRELDVPLTTMRAVLDGTADEAEVLLREHADRLTARADQAWNAVDPIVRALRGTAEPDHGRPTRFSVGGPELAAAVRQVAPFAADTDDGATLDCLLLDVGDAELTVVATDRYRLAARTQQLSGPDGPNRRIPVQVDAIVAIIDWLRRHRSVEVSAVGQTMIISAREQADDPAAEHRELSLQSDHFPDYRHLLSGLSEGPQALRMIIDRVRLLEIIAADQTSSVIVTPDGDDILVQWRNDPELRRVPAVCSGHRHPIAFSPKLLASALQNSVGPDVLIDHAPDHAAVIRSADQGSFTTLVMPMRLEP